MNKMKRIISMLLIAIMLVNLVPADVYATSDTSQDAVDNSGMTIEGTNGFGNLLSEDLTEYQAESEVAESEYEDGYTVTDLVIELNSATVTYDSMEEALLIVALYTEDGLQLLQSAETLVQPEESVAVLTFEGEMPEYFYASAYMVDTYDLSPLCAAYETPMYTREMQELLASTVEDYEADRVLNLDEDTTTNFAVYAESTIVIDDVEGVNDVTGVDDENAIYVIENADEDISGLQIGEVFAYPYAENEMLIVKVKSISIEGTTATITGDDLEMEEVFSHIKIETEGTSADLVVDEVTGDEDITYVGLTNGAPAMYSFNNREIIEGEIGESLGFEINKKIVGKTDGSKVSLIGALNMSYNIKFGFYLSYEKQYIEFKTDIENAISVSVDGTVKGVILELPDIAYMVAGVSIGFEPTIELEFSGEVEWICTLELVLGFSYQNGKGLKNLCEKPKVESKVQFEGSIFLAYDVNPNISVLDDVAEVGLSTPIGIEVTGKMTGTNFEKTDISDEKVHGCKQCIKGEVHGKFETSAEVEFLKGWKSFSTGSLWEIQCKLCEFYYSFDNNEVALGSCPYYKYRLTIVVKDSDGNLQKKIPVATSSGTKCGTTNSNGVIICYLPKGNYTICALLDGNECEKAVKVEEACKVTIEPTKGNKGGMEAILVTF